MSCHVSGVTCHMSNVTCHFFLQFFSYEVVKLDGGGFILAGPSPPTFIIIWFPGSTKIFTDCQLLVIISLCTQIYSILFLINKLFSIIFNLQATNIPILADCEYFHRLQSDLSQFLKENISNHI